jgi:hypothetical protein
VIGAPAFVTAHIAVANAGYAPLPPIFPAIDRRPNRIVGFRHAGNRADCRQGEAAAHLRRQREKTSHGNRKGRQGRRIL